MLDDQQKILVVDDNPVILKLMTNFLAERQGHHVLTAANGLEALEILEDFVPDVIFVDWIMNKISGDQLCRIIRSKPQLQDCFLVILSSMAAEAEADLLAVGADAYIAKGPFKRTAQHIQTLLEEVALKTAKDFSQTILGLDEVHQRQATQELLRRNRHHELILQNISDGIIELASDTGIIDLSQGSRVIFANQAACRFIGGSEEKLLASRLTEHLSDADQKRLEGILAGIKDQPVTLGDDQPLLVNGRYLSVIFIPFVDNQEKYVIGVLRDITAKKKAEIALEKSGQRLQLATEDAKRKEYLLQSIITSAPVGISLAVGRKIYWANEKLSEITGYSAEELQGLSARMFYVNDEEFERVGQEIYGSIEKHGTGAAETQWQRKDGSIIDVLLNASSVDLQDFTDSVTFTVLDVTQQKKAERALHDSEQRLQLALEGADLGMWDWDIQSGSIYYSPRYLSMLGYGPTELPHTLATWEGLLHPDDLQPTRQHLLDCLAQEPSRWSLEFRLRAKDGGYLWILGRGQVVDYGPDGSPLRAAGTHLDITDHKRADEALKKSAREWSAAMDASDDIIYLLDMERRILRANRAFCRITGTTEEALIGRYIVDIMHLQQEEKRLCPICRIQEGKRDAEIILEANDPDNPTSFPLRVVVRVVRGDQGQPISMLMNLHDLSSQRQIEESLRRSKEEWEKTFDSMSDIVTIQDRDMRIVRANRAAHDMLGAELGDLNGQLCYRLFSGTTTPCSGCPEVDTLNSRESHSAIIRHEKLGKIFLVSSSPILDDNKEVQYLVHVAKDITEQRRLEEQQDMLYSLIQQSNDAIYVIDPVSADILFVNRQGLENLGYGCDEMVNLTIYDIAHRLASEEDWQQSLATIRRHGTYLFETSQRRKDNSLLPVEVNARVSRYNGQDFVVAVVRDISERKRAAEKVLQEKNKLEAVVSALGSGLTFQDRHFRVIYQNNVHKEMQGDQLGKFCYEAYHGRDKVCPGCLLAKCFVDGKLHQHEVAMDKGGATIYLDISASPYRDGSGEIIGGVESIRDITDRKGLEAQVQQGQKMEAMGTLAGGIAHDFNNILAAIMGFNEMALQDTPEDNPIHRMLKHVAKGAERARDLVQQILTFSRKADQHKAPMLLQPVIKEVLKLMRATIPATIAVKSNIAPECGLVLADPTLIHQLVMNLCTNSYHAMRETGGQLSITLRPLTVGRELAESIVDLQEGPSVQITVSDTGHGMEQATLKRIFEPYYTTKAQGEGTGLGLAVVHGIVTGLGGAITVASEVGGGTSFDVYLPQAGEGELCEVPGNSGALEGQGHILLVDDEEEIISFGKEMLSRLGYQVTSFNSSREALEAFRQSPNEFELIITDQTMPELTGLDLAQRIMAIRPEMAILLISGYSVQVDAESCRAMGLSGYLKKPFNGYEMGEAVRKILSRA